MLTVLPCGVPGQLYFLVA